MLEKWIYKGIILDPYSEVICCFVIPWKCRSFAHLHVGVKQLFCECIVVHTWYECIWTLTVHSSNVPWVHHPLVSNSRLTIIFYASLFCAFLFRMYISSLHHSFTSSSHSRFGLPLFVSPSVSPNTTSFTSLLSSILRMCPNKFNFLSLILCFSCYPLFFLFLHLWFFLPSYI